MIIAITCKEENKHLNTSEMFLLVTKFVHFKRKREVGPFLWVRFHENFPFFSPQQFLALVILALAT